MKPIAPTLAAIAIAFAGLAGSTQAQEKTVSDAKPVKIVMETSKGTIEMELDAAKAPKTVENFVSYVKKGHYDGLIFHRVIPDFMIQCGGFFQHGISQRDKVDDITVFVQRTFH